MEVSYEKSVKNYVDFILNYEFKEYFYNILSAHFDDEMIYGLLYMSREPKNKSDVWRNICYKILCIKPDEKGKFPAVVNEINSFIKTMKEDAPNSVKYEFLSSYFKVSDECRWWVKKGIENGK